MLSSEVQVVLNSDAQQSLARQGIGCGFRVTLLVIVTWVATVPALAQVGQARVAVLYGAPKPCQAAADALVAGLQSAGYEYAAIQLSSNDPAALETALKQVAEFKPTVIATGGTTATQQALKAVADVPVVFFMVPNALDAPFLTDDFPARGRLTGIASDIDPAQQVDWIKRTQPHLKKIGVLCSSHSRRTVAALEKAGQQRGLVLIPILVNRDEFPKAIEELNKSGCDGVLMIPDAQVYNSPNVQRLLLWGVRQKKPVWTFSANVVKAGAFSGLYCDSKAVGEQVAQLVREAHEGKAPPAIGLHYPHYIARAVNVHTAEMIGVSPDEKVFTSGVVRMGE